MVRHKIFMRLREVKLKTSSLCYALLSGSMSDLTCGQSCYMLMLNFILTHLQGGSHLQEGSRQALLLNKKSISPIIKLYIENSLYLHLSFRLVIYYI